MMFSHHFSVKARLKHFLTQGSRRKSFSPLSPQIVFDLTLVPKLQSRTLDSVIFLRIFPCQNDNFVGIFWKVLFYSHFNKMEEWENDLDLHQNWGLVPGSANFWGVAPGSTGLLWVSCGDANPQEPSDHWHPLVSWEGSHVKIHPRKHDNRKATMNESIYLLLRIRSFSSNRHVSFQVFRFFLSQN